MLEPLLGNKSVEKILLFLLLHQKCYATQLHTLLDAPLTPLQQALNKLERAGIVACHLEGKTRIFQMNPSYPLLKELEELLRKAYSLLPSHVQRKYFECLPNYSKTPFFETTRTASQAFSGKDLLQRLWKKLLTVQHLSFSAKSKADVKSGREGAGKGSVEVKKTEEQSCTFHEKGNWLSTEGQNFDFSNVFRWTIDDAGCAIILEHLRQGPMHPVFIFKLVPVAEGLFESMNPFICNDDTYYGLLKMDEHFIQLKWRTLGPKKNEELDYLYT